MPAVHYQCEQCWQKNHSPKCTHYVIFWYPSMTIVNTVTFPKGDNLCLLTFCNVHKCQVSWVYEIYFLVCNLREYQSDPTEKKATVWYMLLQVTLTHVSINMIKVMSTP